MVCPRIHVETLANSRARAMVKTTDVHDKIRRNSLVKEYNYYRRSSIALSRNIRKMYDTINDQEDWTAQKPFCLAFEWMDTTLAAVSSETHRQSPVLAVNIFKAVLGAFSELEKEQLVYSGTISVSGSAVAIN